jgi:hypothetical protein
MDHDNDISLSEERGPFLGWYARASGETEQARIEFFSPSQNGSFWARGSSTIPAASSLAITYKYNTTINVLLQYNKKVK